VVHKQLHQEITTWVQPTKANLIYVAFTTIKVVVVLPDPFRGIVGRGGIPWRPNSRAMPQGLDRDQKWKRQRWRVGGNNGGKIQEAH